MKISLTSIGAEPTTSHLSFAILRIPNSVSIIIKKHRKGFRALYTSATNRASVLPRLRVNTLGRRLNASLYVLGFVFVFNFISFHLSACLFDSLYGLSTFATVCPRRGRLMTQFVGWETFEMNRGLIFDFFVFYLLWNSEKGTFFIRSPMVRKLYGLFSFYWTMKDFQQSELVERSDLWN